MPPLCMVFQCITAYPLTQASLIRFSFKTLILKNLMLVQKKISGKTCSFEVAYMPLSHFSHVLLFVTLLTVAHQAPLSMGFSRQEYWSGLPFPPPGNQTWSHVSCIDRWVLYIGATWEAPGTWLSIL